MSEELIKLVRQECQNLLIICPARVVNAVAKLLEGMWKTPKKWESKEDRMLALAGLCLMSEVMHGVNLEDNLPKVNLK
jgi:hypothetical protein